MTGMPAAWHSTAAWLWPSLVVSDCRSRDHLDAGADAFAGGFENRPGVHEQNDAIGGRLQGRNAGRAGDAADFSCGRVHRFHIGHCFAQFLEDDARILPFLARHANHGYGGGNDMKRSMLARDAVIAPVLPTLARAAAVAKALSPRRALQFTNQRSHPAWLSGHGFYTPFDGCFGGSRGRRERPVADWRDWLRRHGRRPHARVEQHEGVRQLPHCGGV